MQKGSVTHTQSNRNCFRRSTADGNMRQKLQGNHYKYAKKTKGHQLKRSKGKIMMTMSPQIQNINKELEII